MLDVMLAGIGGVAGFCALAGLACRIWPGLLTGLSTWLYSHVDPGRIPYDSIMNRHWSQSRELVEGQERMRESLVEIRKDTIKNTILQLIQREGDHSDEVAYELSKLEDLHAECWVMDVARDYIKKQRFA